MRLTIQNCEEYIGKTLDSYRRLHHHYPLTVICGKGRIYGEPIIRDAIGTCFPVPDETDLFNRVDFDFVAQEQMMEDAE